MRRWDLIILYDDIRLRITAKRKNKKQLSSSRSVGYSGARFIDWKISSFYFFFKFMPITIKNII